MKITRQIVVFDAADLAAESALWTGMPTDSSSE